MDDGILSTFAGRVLGGLGQAQVRFDQGTRHTGRLRPWWASSKLLTLGAWSKPSAKTRTTMQCSKPQSKVRSTSSSAEIGTCFGWGRSKEFQSSVWPNSSPHTAREKTRHKGPAHLDAVQQALTINVRQGRVGHARAVRARPVRAPDLANVAPASGFLDVVGNSLVVRVLVRRDRRRRVRGGRGEEPGARSGARCHRAGVAPCVSDQHMVQEAVVEPAAVGVPKLRAGPSQIHAHVAVDSSIFS